MARAPHDSAVVKLDVEYMADVAAPELAYHLPGVQVPHLDRLVVAPAHEPSARWVERQRADERVVAGQRPQTRPGVRVPDLDLTIAGPRDDEVPLHGGVSMRCAARTTG